MQQTYHKIPQGYGGIDAGASDNVIQRALERVKHLPQYEENKELLKILDDKITRMIHRDKLTDIAMSLVV